jgi:orotate phosphoribosyltransferase
MPTEDKNLKRKFTRTLLEVGAIKFGKFRLTSGKTSSYYIDLRVLPSYPAAFHQALQVYGDTTRRLGVEKFRIIVGIPTSGMVYASPLAYKLRKPFAYIRKEAKEWGRERKVEGVLKQGYSALLVDDVITTGKSIIEAANAIRAEGGVVEHTLVLVDREEGGRKKLKSEGIRLHQFLRIGEILEFMLEFGKIKPEQYEEILRQVHV